MNIRRCLLSVLCAFVLSSVLFSASAYASETDPEFPDNYITGVTQAEDIHEGYTYQFVEFENMYLENVVIGTPDELATLESGEPNKYPFIGTAQFSALSGSTAGYNNSTNNYNFIATATILIPLTDLTNDYNWLTNEEYTFNVYSGSVHVSSNLGGAWTGGSTSTFGQSLVEQNKFKTAGASLRPLNEDIITLNYDYVINNSVISQGSTSTGTGGFCGTTTSFDITNISGSQAIVYTGDVSGREYYLAVTFTKGFSASGANQTSLSGANHQFLNDNKKQDWTTQFEFPYYGDITIEYNLPVPEEDESVGLLNGIIEWIQGIYNSIVELPSRIWTYISDGLTSLFIPSEEAMVGIKDDWDELLASRFGAVYEAGTIMIEFASGLTETAEQEFIEFPEVEYVFSGVPFRFGGWNVDIVPDQFNWLADVLKGVLDIVCTLAFLNTLRKKYDEMVG